MLTFFVNAGLSSRLTRDLLWGLFGIKLSHQTIINYVNAAAARIAPFLDADLPKPGPIAAADETYLIIENEWHYTWFIIDAASRAICGYNLSDTRGTVPALATLHDAYGKPETNPPLQTVGRTPQSHLQIPYPAKGRNEKHGRRNLPDHFICSILQLPQAAWRIEAFTAEPGTIARH